MLVEYSIDRAIAEAAAIYFGKKVPEPGKLADFLVKLARIKKTGVTSIFLTDEEIIKFLNPPEATSSDFDDYRIPSTASPQ